MKPLDISLTQNANSRKNFPRFRVYLLRFTKHTRNLIFRSKTRFDSGLNKTLTYLITSIEIPKKTRQYPKLAMNSTKYLDDLSDGVIITSCLLVFSRSNEFIPVILFHKHRSSRNVRTNKIKRTEEIRYFDKNYVEKHYSVTKKILKYSSVEMAMQCLNSNFDHKFKISANFIHHTRK